MNIEANDDETKVFMEEMNSSVHTCVITMMIINIGFMFLFVTEIARYWSAFIEIFVPNNNDNRWYYYPNQIIYVRNFSMMTSFLIQVSIFVTFVVNATADYSQFTFQNSVLQ